MEIKTQKTVTKWAIAVLVLFYLHILYIQYTDIFFEAQFLHVNFIQDLINHHFNPQNFFASYGEHFFPGYNVLLYLNFKFYKINALFELVCSALASFATAYVLIKAFKQETSTSWWLPIAVCFVVFSPIQHVLWGMALAAHISTLLLVIILFLIYFNESRDKFYLLAILIPIYVVFFAGAYCVGFLASLISIFIFANYKKDKKLLIALVIISAFAYFLYDYLLKTYMIYAYRPPEHYHYDLDIINRFIDAMLAASVLGKSFFERTHLFIVYYAVGIYLIIVGTVAYFLTVYKNKLIKLDYFFSALLAYVLANILVVAVARNTNGADGSLGDWYQTHLQFLPIAIFYFLSRMATHTPKQKTLQNLAVLSIFGLLALGGFYEYDKAPHIKEWKNSINSSVADHLAHPSYYSAGQHPEPMLWRDYAVNQGLRLFYFNHLAYFRGNKSYSSALTSDQWLKKSTLPFFSVVCPMTAKSVTLVIDHIEPNNLKLLANDFKIQQIGDTYQLSYIFHEQIKATSFSIDHFALFNNPNPKDQRPLLFHVKSIECSQDA